MPAPAPRVTAEDVLDRYTRLLERTTRMRQQAREQDWEALLAEEAHYVAEVAHLEDSEDALTFTTAQTAYKAELLGHILAHAGQVRHCLETRRDDLGRLIDSTRRTRDLGKAYGLTASPPPGNERP